MLHENRQRAESFGAFADRYDRFRPTYPESVFDALGPLKDKRVLDVGCGTGKAARRFTEKGATVLGLDIDDRMAAVARSHGIAVEVASFESWNAKGRTFDLVASGQAWHWVDPETGANKAADVLVEGGRLAVFWNYGHPKVPSLDAEIQKTIDESVPELASKYAKNRDWRSTDETMGHKDKINRSGRFEPCESHDFPWEWRIAAKDWLSLLQTHSDIALLSDDDRSTLLDALARVTDRFSGELVFEYATFCLLATKAG